MRDNFHKFPTDNQEFCSFQSVIVPSESISIVKRTNECLKAEKSHKSGVKCQMESPSVEKDSFKHVHHERNFNIAHACCKNV